MLCDVPLVTAWAYLMKYEPHVIGLLDQPATEIARVEPQAQELARELGLPAVYVLEGVLLGEVDAHVNALATSPAIWAMIYS